MVKFGKWEYTEEELEQQHKEATKRGKEADKREPRAKAVKYDRETNRLKIDLTNGAIFIVPCDLIQGLRGADPNLIAEVEILGRGYALHWETLDQDYTVPGLVAGLFGTKRWMAELGRLGGRKTSERKAAAVQENGRLGGRPRKAKVS